jgi:hypothetical protein
MNVNVVVADLRRWSDHYRLFAGQATDPQRRARFREMAEFFERKIAATRTEEAVDQVEARI